MLYISYILYIYIIYIYIYNVDSFVVSVEIIHENLAQSGDGIQLS